MAALDNIASELLKSANEADLIYKRTRDQAQRDKAVRLRRIVENLRNITLGASDLNGLSDVAISSPTNAQVLSYNSTTLKWQNTTISTATPTLAQVTTAGNTTTNAITVGKTTVIHTPSNGDYIFRAESTQNRLELIHPGSGGATLQMTSTLNSGYTKEFIMTGKFKISTEYFGNAVYFGNSSTTYTIFTNTNNFAIGTTTDAGYKLDVNGTIRSSGTNGLVLYDGTYGAKVSMSSYIFTIEREGTYGVSTYQFKYSANSDALYLTGLTSIVGIGGGTDAVMMSRNVYAPHNAAFGFTTYGSTTRYKAIQAIYTDNNTSGVAFNYKTAGTDTEAMRITSAGQVGIGTTTPTYKLQVIGSTYNTFSTTAPFLVDTSANNYRIGNLINNSGYNTGGFANNTFDIFSVGANSSSSSNASQFFRININGGSSSGAYGASGNNVTLAQLNAVTNSILYITAQGSGGYIQGSTSSGLTVSTLTYGENLSLRSDMGSGFGGGGINYYASINGANHSHRWFTTLTEHMRLTSGGNLLIGTTTDAGYKLDVNGTLRVQADLSIANGRYKLGGAQVGLYATTDLGLTVNTGSGNSFLGYYATGDTSYIGTTVTLGRLSSVNLNAVSGLQEMVRITGNYAPTSGTGLFTALQLSNTINQTGGANGITRGLYISPTLTSAFDYRAIETTAGNVVFNGGNVGIGTSNPLYKLHVTDSAGDIVYILASTGQSAIIGATGSGTNRMYIGYSPGAENISITSSGVVRLNSITSGNVLIGTTTDAGYKLQVQGSGYFNTNTASTNSILKLTDNVNGTAWVGFSSTTTTGFFIGSNGGMTLGRVTADNSNPSSSHAQVIINQSGNANLQLTTNTANTGIVFSDGVNATIRMNFPSAGEAAITTISAHNLSIGVASSVGSLSSTTMKFFQSTGNVAINSTTDAGYKLDVNGTVRAQVSLSGIPNIIHVSNLQTDGGPGGAIAFYTGGVVGNASRITAQRSGPVGQSDIALETNGVTRLFVSVLGNIGLGTTNPTDKFHIVDNTNGNKFGRISAGGTDASAAWVAQNDQVDNVVYRVFGSAVTGTQMGQALARSASLIANLGGTGKFLIGSFSGTDLIFGTSDQARMRLVDSTGNFLIGTMTDTGNKLTVSGNIDAQGYKVNNVLGYTGILNIPTNPPGQQNIDIQGGIVINIF